MIGDVGGVSQIVTMLGRLVVSILAARLFYASLIRDTFRVRLDTGGAQISDLVGAHSRNSASAHSSATKSKIDIVHRKPWKIFNLPSRLAHVTP